MQALASGMAKQHSPAALAHVAALQVGLQMLSPPAQQPSGSAASRLAARISSGSLLDVTVAPSSIVAAKQLQALLAAAAAWQGDPHLLQQLLLVLAAPAGSQARAASAASCWLVNETGAPLSFAVADAALSHAAAIAAVGVAGGGGSASNSPLKPPAAGAAAGSVRGRAGHKAPVPLHVLDMAAARYHGRFVEPAAVNAGMFDLPPASSSSIAVSQGADAGAGGGSSAPAAPSGGVKRSQLLYVQAAGQLGVTGPVALGQLGCSIHPLRSQVDAFGGSAGGSAQLPRYALRGVCSLIALCDACRRRHCDATTLPP
jgi:hypothetical protein